MKKSWSKLASKLSDLPESHREQKMISMFLLHHQNSEEIVYGMKSGKPLAAIYLMPGARDHKHLIDFFKAVRKRLYWESEGYGNEPES